MEASLKSHRITKALRRFQRAILPIIKPTAQLPPEVNHSITISDEAHVIQADVMDRALLMSIALGPPGIGKTEFIARIIEQMQRESQKKDDADYTHTLYLATPRAGNFREIEEDLETALHHPKNLLDLSDNPEIAPATANLVQTLDELMRKLGPPPSNLQVLQKQGLDGGGSQR